MKLTAFVALLATLAVAGYWDIELVDSTATYGTTVACAPDARLAVAYLSGDTAVCVAIRDTAWKCEIVDSPGFTSPAIAVGPQGSIGVAYYRGGIRYAERTVSGWDTADLPSAGYHPGLAYDTAGIPLVTSLEVPSAGNVVVYAQTRADTGWQTREIYRSSPGMPIYGSCASPRFGRHNQAYVFVSTYWYIFQYVWGADLTILSGRGDTWQIVRDSAMDDFYPAEDLALDTADNPVWCFSHFGPLFVEGQLVDSLGIGASLQFDEYNQPHVAYLAGSYNAGGLRYAYRTPAGWHILEPPDTATIGSCGLVFDVNGQPVIAYVHSQGGLYIAHGVDVVGQSEERREPTAFGSRLTATVALGVLFLPDQPSTASAALFDLSGRRVADLHPGANDVSGIAPGVYFIVEAQAQAPAQAVGKIVIAR